MFSEKDKIVRKPLENPFGQQEVQLSLHLSNAQTSNFEVTQLTCFWRRRLGPFAGGS